jgi:hypothetical protein
MMPMPSSLPIPKLGLTFKDLVDVIQTCSLIRSERLELGGLRKTITTRLRLSNPVLSLKVSRLDSKQMDALYNYVQNAREAPR